jgi:hypothetical protein
VKANARPSNGNKKTRNFLFISTVVLSFLKNIRTSQQTLGFPTNRKGVTPNAAMVNCANGSKYSFCFKYQKPIESGW